MRLELLVPDPLVPRPYQEDDAERASRGYADAAFLGHEMGVGKTLICVEAILKRLERLPADRRDRARILIIAPLNTHPSWRDTILAQTHGSARVLNCPPASANSPQTGLFWRAIKHRTPGWYIIGWENFVGRLSADEAEKLRKQRETEKKNNSRKKKRKPNLDWARTGHWEAAVLDECHRMSNPRSLAYTTAETISTSYKAALSGTPARNRVEGFWAVLSWLWPHLYHNDRREAVGYWTWVKRELHWERTPYGSGIKIIGERPGRRIADQIPLYIRRTTSEVIRDLPPVVEQVIEVPLLRGAQTDAYRDMERQYFSWMGDQPLGAYMDSMQFLRLRQLALGVPTVTATGTYDEDGREILDVNFDPDCASNKISALKDLLADLPPDEAVLVLTHSARFTRPVVHQLNQAGLGPAVGYTGATPAHERQQTLTTFGHPGGPRVLVAGIAAIAEGTDGLQKVCRNEVWLSELEDVAITSQARKRLHRPGQTDTVRRWYIRSTDTADTERHLAITDTEHTLRDVYAAPSTPCTNTPSQS